MRAASNRPASRSTSIGGRTALFVASFLGLPEINLVPGGIENAVDGIRFLGDGLTEPLPLVAVVRPGPAMLGLRPQALTGVRPGAAASHGASLGGARVLAVEHHGPESFATCRLQTRSMTVEISPASGIAIGDEIGIFADLSDVHLFDPGTGQRLVSGSAEGGFDG
jgi:multiple sugar transport system ATP-binding protein